MEDEVISRISEVEEGQEEFFKAITGGIIDWSLENLKVSVSYSGIIPGTPPIPDPIVEDKLSLTELIKPIYQPWETLDEFWEVLIEGLVSGIGFGKGLLGLSYVTPIPAFLPSPKPEIPKFPGDLGDDPQKKAWEIICNKVLEWMMGQGLVRISLPGKNEKTGSLGMLMAKKIEKIGN